MSTMAEPLGIVDEINARRRMFRAAMRTRRQEADAIGTGIDWKPPRRAGAPPLKPPPAPPAPAATPAPKVYDIPETPPGWMSRDQKIDMVLTIAAQVWGVDRAMLLSPRRDRRYAWARHAVCVLLKRHTALSLSQIGRRLGGRDHTTIMHAIQNHEQRIKVAAGAAPATLTRRTRCPLGWCRDYADRYTEASGAIARRLAASDRLERGESPCQGE